MRKRLTFGWLALVALTATSCSCVEPRAAGVPPAATESASAAAAAAASAPAPVTATASATASTKAWVEAVRLERWNEAASLIDALPESERGLPAMRYVRGRVALALGDLPRAVELLTGIEKDLPLLADDITRRRAEAAAEVGPYAEAAAFFARSGQPADLRKAATALEKAGQPIPARATLDRAVAAAQRSRRRSDEISARAARARLEEAQGLLPAAIADLRWLAVEAASREEGRAAAEALTRLKQPLTDKEKLAAAMAMVKGGSPGEAVAILDELAKRGTVPADEVAHARAEAHMKARSFAEAEKAFRAAAARKNPRQAEQLYQAATALARAGQPDQAIRSYLDLSARYRKNTWAERALHAAARLLLIRGRYDEATHLYTRYLNTFPKGSLREDAEYEQALALLSGGEPKAARTRLMQLAKAQSRTDEAQKLRELEGLAAMRAGDRDGAVRIWTEVARAFPLSWAALAARARLAEVGADVPPLLDPPTPRPFAPLDLSLPEGPALLTSLGLDADAESRLSSLEREAAARYAGRESEALCGMYGLLSHAKRRYRVGVASVGLPVLLRAPAEADRWAWECLYPRPYVSEVRKLEEQQHLPRGLVHALMRQESAFDQEAMSPVSAVGLMQLMPATARKAAAEAGVEYDAAKLKSPAYNLTLGSFYAGKLLRIFKGNPVLAVAAYNAGPQAVGLWLPPRSDGDADLWVARIPYDETRNYVARVMGNLARYQWLEGGDSAVTTLPLVMPIDIEVPADAY